MKARSFSCLPCGWLRCYPWKSGITLKIQPSMGILMDFTHEQQICFQTSGVFTRKKGFYPEKLGFTHVHSFLVCFLLVVTPCYLVLIRNEVPDCLACRCFCMSNSWMLRSNVTWRNDSRVDAKFHPQFRKVV